MDKIGIANIAHKAPIYSNITASLQFVNRILQCAHVYIKYIFVYTYRQILNGCIIYYKALLYYMKLYVYIFKPCEFLIRACEIWQLAVVMNQTWVSAWLICMGWDSQESQNPPIKITLFPTLCPLSLIYSLISLSLSPFRFASHFSIYASWYCTTMMAREMVLRKSLSLQGIYYSDSYILF